EGATSRLVFRRVAFCGKPRVGMETLSDQIDLSASVARRPRFTHMHLIEAVLRRMLQIGKAFTLKRLDDQVAAGSEPSYSEFQRKFTQMNASRLIDGVDAGYIGRKVRKHKVDLPAPERPFELTQCGILAEIALDKLNIGNRLHWQQVHGNDPRSRP